MRERAEEVVSWAPNIITLSIRHGKQLRGRDFSLKHPRHLADELILAELFAGVVVGPN
jgi:hypothetical protein